MYIYIEIEIEIGLTTERKKHNRLNEIAYKSSPKAFSKWNFTDWRFR